MTASTHTPQPALLALADGTLWPGLALGKRGDRVGEIVFNTSITGYQEILTDPSYHGQIVVLTQPHIGNYGVNDADDESERAWAAGLVVRAASPIVSNWRSARSLDDYLRDREIVAITDVDTRALTRRIRTFGAQNAAISSVRPEGDYVIDLARSAPDMNGLDLAREVTCAEPYHYSAAADAWGLDLPATPERRYRVVAYDFGIKRNILRLLAAHGCDVTVVPAQTTAEEALALNPDGVFLSNGPGDPAACTYAIESVRGLLGRVPVFGICLGHQILGLALGGTTYKLKFGHRGGNQPVQRDGAAVEISSHNHGFAVDSDSLPSDVVVSHVNLNDRCCEGLRAPGRRAFSVQYHPEAAPGPHDARYLFDDFIALMSTSD